MPSAARPEPRLEETQVLLERALLGWGSASVVAGALLVGVGHRAGRPGWVAAGQQHAGWGAVDAALGLWGRHRRLRRVADPGRDEAAELTALRRLLTLNAGLDVGYVVVGTALAAAPGRVLARWPERVGTARATGLAVVIQGSFLLVLDSLAVRVSGSGDAQAKRS